MFTGIVRELGQIEMLERAGAGARLVVRAPETAASTRTGESVAVHGVCLTATDVRDGVISFDAVPETLERSSLARLGKGARVNVEPALRAGEPLGGHLVQGHVDGIGFLRTVDPEGEGARAAIAAPTELLRYCAEKGSIAVDGVSLTIAAVEGDVFRVVLVPHTLRTTTLGTLRPGDQLNLEVDVIAKYVERLLESRAE